MPVFGRSVSFVIVGSLLVLGPGGTTAAFAGSNSRDSATPSIPLLAAITALATPIPARCWRFDDLQPGSVLTNYRGASFTNTDGPLRVVEDMPGPPFTAPNSILPDYFYNPGNLTRATPPDLVRGAKVTMGDYDADEDTIYLVAYDSHGNQIDSDTDVLPQTLEGGLWLEVDSDSVGIAYIEFWGEGIGQGNSVYFDNVCFLK